MSEFMRALQTACSDEQRHALLNRLRERLSGLLETENLPGTPLACKLASLKQAVNLDWSTVSASADIHIYFEYSDQVFTCKSSDLRRLLADREPWEDHDLVCFDSGITLCCVVTHNGQEKMIRLADDGTGK